MNATTLSIDHCYHCGLDLPPLTYAAGDKKFCCDGCRQVYVLLESTGMCGYYQYNDMPGHSPAADDKHTGYLEDEGVISKIVDYKDNKSTVVTFYIPAIHCSSCIWLLEHLYKINAGISHSSIDFLKKEVCITFKHLEISLRELVGLLDHLGYEPLITPHDISSRSNDQHKPLVQKIAIAGFCMGNVMLFSFPHYFGIAADDGLKEAFCWLNLAFIVPVTFYCARDFFSSAVAGLKSGIINIDAPLALIIAILFIRTASEILAESGPGFSDTLTGLVFLLLVGRWVRQRSYQHFSFDRDYRSYFPMAITVLAPEGEKTVLSDALKTGDKILIRNKEIVPADAMLLKGNAYLDFSFVTGEANPVLKQRGDLVHAGGRQVGGTIELAVLKPVSQSYLTGLWSNKAVEGRPRPQLSFNDAIAKYFGTTSLIIAVLASSFWLFQSDMVRAWNAFTAVLIVACPCVLTLSTPFTLTRILNVFDRNNFYLKNTDVVERLATTDTIVFDKTGTITCPGGHDLLFSGFLQPEDKILLASLARNSTHPLSRQLVNWAGACEYQITDHFNELPGKGIIGIVNGHKVAIGKSELMSNEAYPRDKEGTFAEIDGLVVGQFSLRPSYRPGIPKLIADLRHQFSTYLLSGDTDAELERLNTVFDPATLHFSQSPFDKMNFIKKEQGKAREVMMIGDGLNDAGALMQSNVGVAVTDNTNNFNPACDAILDGGSLFKLPKFLSLAKDATKVIKWNLIISATYNLVGLLFAVQGTLSPLTAAVLMPLSTLTILAFSSAASGFFINRNQLA